MAIATAPLSFFLPFFIYIRMLQTILLTLHYLHTFTDIYTYMQCLQYYLHLATS